VLRQRSRGELLSNEISNQVITILKQLSSSDLRLALRNDEERKDKQLNEMNDNPSIKKVFPQKFRDCSLFDQSSGGVFYQ
jgi:hypothetical protein